MSGDDLRSIAAAFRAAPGKLERAAKERIQHAGTEVEGAMRSLDGNGTGAVLTQTGDLGVQVSSTTTTGLVGDGYPVPTASVPAPMVSALSSQLAAGLASDGAQALVGR